MARRIAGVVAALACLGAGWGIYNNQRRSTSDALELAARNDANRRALALADFARRDIEKLIPTAVAAATVQEIQEMVRQSADAATFLDFMVHEGSWKGFRTTPLSSALYLDHQLLAQTSNRIPDDADVRQLVNGAGVQGRGVILGDGARGLTTVAAARMPVVARGESPREAVVLVARALEPPAQEGGWLFSDGTRLLGAEQGVDSLGLVGREAQTPLTLAVGIASASQVHPGLWAWAVSPVAESGSGSSLATLAAAALVALTALYFAFRSPGALDDRTLIAQTNLALRQSQEQLQRLSQRLDLPGGLASQPLARTAPSLEAPQASRYEVVALLGEGGMARVFLAVTRGAEGFKRAFVLKRLRPEMMGNPDAVTHFIDEARLGSSLVHSNIVPVFDFGRDTEGYYLAQEYILGRDLDAVRKASLDVRRAPIEVPLVLFVAVEALKALAYAHNRKTEAGVPMGLVHRDVSPNNLMISAQGEVKLLDLGIAKSDQNVTRTQAGMVKGNVFYMSPEQARGEPVDARADLFSLGLVLFTAATGDTLYQGASNYELLNRAGEGLGPKEWQRVAMLPPELSALLTRALQPDASARFASAQEFGAAIAPGAVGSASALQQLMNSLFAEEFRLEQTRFQVSSRPA